MSRVLELHDYLVLIGDLPQPLFLNGDREVVADLEAKGMLESPDALLDYLKIPAVGDTEWLREPVPVREWANDPYYVGEAYAGTLFPKLLDDLEEVFDTKRDPPVREVVCTGSIGYGKSYFVAWCMNRQIYEISCLAHPHKVLGISPGTDIVMLNMSVTGKQAKNAIYKYVFNMISRSPYYKEHFPRDATIDSEIRFLREQVVFWPGHSRETASIGANVVSGVIDEANFLVSASKSAHEKLQGEVEHALILYRALATRVKSRYMFSKGFKGRLYLCSSKMYQGDFIDQHRAAVRDDLAVKVMDYNHWEVRDPKQYCGEKFKVVLGSIGVRARIVKEGDHVAPTAQVINVPVEYKGDFERDLDGSVRDLAGIATLALSPMMDPEAVVRQQVTEWDGHPLVHPFSDDTNGLPSDSIVLNESAICEQYEVEEGVGPDGKPKVTKLWRPKRSPDAFRYIHVDLALKNDACGFAMCYVAGEREVVQWNRETRTEERELVPIIVFEVLGAFTAPIGDEIRGTQIRALIHRLRALGFYFGVITFDQFQSADSRQVLSDHGFETDELSVDKDPNAYETLRDGLRDGWVYYYPNKTAQRELLKVQRTIRKRQGMMRGKVIVDHPERDMDNRRTGLGSKDLSDAMAATVWYIKQNYTPTSGLLAPTAGYQEGDDAVKGPGQDTIEHGDMLADESTGRDFDWVWQDH